MIQVRHFFWHRSAMHFEREAEALGLHPTVIPNHYWGPKGCFI
jgi:hypothetical protein